MADARGENQIDYRYEYYAEDNHRMTINTHSVYFEQQSLIPSPQKGSSLMTAFPAPPEWNG